MKYFLLSVLLLFPAAAGAGDPVQEITFDDLRLRGQLRVKLRGQISTFDIKKRLEKVNQMSNVEI